MQIYSLLNAADKCSLNECEQPYRQSQLSKKVRNALKHRISCYEDLGEYWRNGGTVELEMT